MTPGDEDAAFRGGFVDGSGGLKVAGHVDPDVPAGEFDYEVDLSTGTLQVEAVTSVVREPKLTHHVDKLSVEWRRDECQGSISSSETNSKPEPLATHSGTAP